MYRRPPRSAGRPAEQLKVRAAEFDLEWCLRLIPVFVLAGAGCGFWVAIELTFGDFGHTVFLNVALAVWLVVVSLAGAGGGFVVGMLSCSAAASVGCELYRAMHDWPPFVKTSITLIAQVAVLSFVAIIATIWFVFSGGSDSPVKYRGM